MIPFKNNEWIAWLDDFGNMRKDAPIHIQEQYKDWEKKQEELNKLEE
jgi:DNA repair ATPase RecN